MSWSVFTFNELREMRGDHVVDIGGIAAHHCINIAFIMPMPHILGRNMEGLFGDLNSEDTCWVHHPPC
jgi:hypothetical protein